MNIPRTFRPGTILALGLALGLAALTAPLRAQAPNPAANAQTAPSATTTNGAAAGPGKAQAGEARNIRFQFDGIPYADVIERFAQMSGKPVVGEVNLPGTITFNDPNAYNYAEAFDTLNVILSMKGQMIVEEGNFLRVLPFCLISPRA